MIITLASVIGLSACTYDEPNGVADIKGQVRIPKEAVVHRWFDDEGVEHAIEGDPRVMGPVYLGAFSGVTDADFGYPHPNMGPIVDADEMGDTYPYGGTTVGRFAPGCYESLVCKMVTGRYSSYQDALDFFNDELMYPVLDLHGNPVVDGTAFQERCYDVFFLTSDAEVDFLRQGVNFEEQGDYFVADFEMVHAKYKEGMSLWGWVDMPAGSEFNFASCNDAIGRQLVRYSEDIDFGTHIESTLNFPDNIIDDGDWVGEEGVVVDDPNGEYVITLGVQYND